MGFITETIEIGINAKNQKHYENLGYDIPKTFGKNGLPYIKAGTKIWVKVDHLTKGSNAKLDYSCDRCGDLLKVTKNDYSNHNHDGKYYCRKCSAFLFNSGENSGKYNPNKTDEERENGRSYPEYLEFIRNVLARDNYTCQCCGKEHDDIEVHHLDGYNWCIEKRTDETNALLLCSTCHSNFHSIYGRGNNTKEQFEEWIGRTITLMKNQVEILPFRQIYCIETNMVYESVNIMCNQLNIPICGKIYDICNKKPMNKSCHNYHFLWADDYYNMTEKDISDYLDNCNHRKNEKKIICLETQEIFKNASLASEKYSNSGRAGGTHIINNCKGRSIYAYKLKDGTPLHWRFYEDFLKLPIEEQNEILSRNQESSNDGSFIM